MNKFLFSTIYIIVTAKTLSHFGHVVALVISYRTS